MGYYTESIDNKTFEEFQMTFNNGYTIHIKFGYCYYCNDTNMNSCEDAEISIFSPLGDIYRLPEWNSDAESYCCTDEIAEYIFKVKNI